MVKPGRLVAGKILGVGGVVAAIAIAAYVFRSTDAGTKIINSLKGFGDVTGQSLLAPFAGILAGVNKGAGAIVEETGKIGQFGAAAGANLSSYAEAIAAGDFQSIIDGTYLEKYGAPGDQSKGAEQQPAKATQPTDTKTTTTTSTRVNADPRPTSTTATVPPQKTPQTNNPKTSPSSNVRTTTVQTRVTSPTSGVTTNKQVETRATNTVKFRQLDGDIVYVSPSTAKALEARGVGKIITNQSPKVRTG